MDIIWWKKHKVMPQNCIHISSFSMTTAVIQYIPSSNKQGANSGTLFPYDSKREMYL